MPKLNTAKIISYWKESAKESWRVARALYEKREYPYALFFGHLTLEKTLKALSVKKTKTHAKYTHNLLVLAADTRLKLTNEEEQFLNDVTKFNIETRYPEDIQKFYKKYREDAQLARNYFKRIKKFYLWLQKKI